jgi:PIN domain nuclease of toxin-antitoxin system
MRLLLDTHAVLWWLKGVPKLSKTAEQAIADRGNEILASVVSAYEIGLKVRAGKLNDEVAREFPIYLDRADIRVLPLSLAHMSMGAALDWAHRDPWDRLILAQSLLEDCTLVTVVRRQPGRGVVVSRVARDRFTDVGHGVLAQPGMPGFAPPA